MPSLPDQDFPVRFGIVSPGRWGRKLLDAARGSAALRCSGVCSRDAANASAVAQAYGGRIFPDYECMLSDPEIEAVILPTPHFLHHGQAMAALKAGKHVFVEKPIATTVAFAEEMVRASAEAKLVLAVGHQARFTGAARRIKAMLDLGEFGRLSSIVIAQGFPLLLDASGTGWRTVAENVPGGPLDEFGVHYFEALQYWCGPVRRVTGFANRTVTPNRVPDVAVAVLEFANGVIASYTAHFVSVGLSRMTLFGTQGALEVNRFGEGACTWQPVTDMATARSGGAPAQPITFTGPKLLTTALTAELDGFAQAIRGNTRPEVGGPESLSTLRICRAVLEANETGRTVTLPR